jgi:hypothetical protein
MRLYVRVQPGAPTSIGTMLAYMDGRAFVQSARAYEHELASQHHLTRTST